MPLVFRPAGKRTLKAQSRIVEVIGQMSARGEPS
jgi:hypothetical protein